MTGAAVVVTYESEREVESCLRALRAAGVEIWVVDNASADRTVALVREHFPEARVITNSVNRGFARAVNQALARVRTDAVLLVNPDCVVPPQTTGALLRYLAANPGVGVVGPRLRGEDGRIAVSAHPFETLASVVASRFGGSLVPAGLRRLLATGRRRSAQRACWSGAEALPVDWVSGACMAVRRSLLSATRGLDCDYFMYYEDEELCFQARLAGLSVVYLPEVEATHAGGASSVDPTWVWPHLYRSLLRFHARHLPRTLRLVRAAILLRALVGVGLGLCRDVLALRRRPGRRTRAWMRIARIAAGPPIQVDG